jgi:hypothetical protein
MRRVRFSVVLSWKERTALDLLARRDGLSRGAVVRWLVRQAARDQGLWPGSAGGGDLAGSTSRRSAND